MTESTPAAFPLKTTLICLVALVILVSLGAWQVHRAEEKRTVLAQLQSGDGVVVSLQQAASAPQHYKGATLRGVGQVDAGRYYLLDNKVYRGQVGYEVVVPTQTQQGWLLVNLGWIPGSRDRSVWPEPGLATGALELQGTVYVPSENPFITEHGDSSGSSQWPKRIQQINLSTIAAQLDGALLPYVLYLAPEHPAAKTSLWQPVVMPPEKHLAYAAQWFGLAVALFTIFWFAVLKPYRSLTRERA